MTNPFTAANRKTWDERVDIHLRDTGEIYPIDAFRNGADVLMPIEAGEIGDVSGLRIAHLQCHFGLDSLSLARRGADVTGLDFSASAIEAARALAAETGIEATFVEADVYEARARLSGEFDVVYVTWGTIIWLPDIPRWAEVVASLLKPGGRLYLAESHPFLRQTEQADGKLVVDWTWRTPADAPLAFDEAETYAGDGTPLETQRSYEWMHSLSDIVGGLVDAGLTLEFLHEHDSLPWPHVPMMRQGEDRMFRLPEDVAGPPLSFSLSARKRPRIPL
jgi:2-polyprenyl-3-methyl-5-hydroxy-6-metoxy-1,4-benzoquinol methylase